MCVIWKWAAGLSSFGLAVAVTVLAEIKESPENLMKYTKRRKEKQGLLDFQGIKRDIRTKY